MALLTGAVVCPIRNSDREDADTGCPPSSIARCRIDERCPTVAGPHTDHREEGIRSRDVPRVGFRQKPPVPRSRLVDDLAPDVRPLVRHREPPPRRGSHSPVDKVPLGSTGPYGGDVTTTGTSETVSADEPGPMYDDARRRTPARRRADVSGALVLGGSTGAVIRGFFPPFVLDQPFWRDFWSGPPAAGLFAVCAAVIAFFPAHRATRIAGESAAREQWWKRAEWALGRAGSDSQVDREVANDALQALLATATRTEASMILRTMDNLQRGGAKGDDQDTVSQPKDDEHKWRWPRWGR